MDKKAITNAILSGGERREIPYDSKRGLTREEVVRSAEENGTNALQGAKKISFLRRFFSNFSDPIIRILLISCAANAALNFRDPNYLEIGGILVAVFLSTFVSALFEHSSQGAFERLCRRAEERYDVIRGGRRVLIPHGEIVVGDVICLRSGEVIPCDGAVLRGELRCDQSPLTGESRTVTKRGDLPSSGVFPLYDHGGDTDDAGSVFSGCGVVSGEGTVLALRVGEGTLFGSLAASLRGTKDSSPLKERLSHLAKRISVIGYIGATLVALSYLVNAFYIDGGMSIAGAIGRMGDLRYTASSLLSALTVAISVLVVAVPEGLPMMITVVLSSNMKRMARKNVLVRRMVGIETGGSLSVLFCDKTGTLTEGRMSVTSLTLPDGREVSSAKLRRDSVLCACVSACAPLSGQNPTDLAFTAFARGARTPPVLRRLPFESARRFSAAALEVDGRTVTVIRGAPELLLPHVGYVRTDGGVRSACGEDIERIRSEVSSYASEGARVILLCFTEGNRLGQFEEGSLGELIYLGAARLSDPIRRDARDAVKSALGAGVRVIMVTGDGRETAEYVARQCSILTDGVSVSGAQIREMGDGELDMLLPRLSVVYRALPSDKLRLVERGRAIGMVTGMTGDGVNDAPSLSRADVGFAMGSGSDVAAAAADIVILDSGLSSIVSAILFGRTVFKSIRKFIFFQLTMNLCATAVSFIGPFIGIDAPVTVVQMLWINMIMDTLGALAFAGEAPKESYLREKPVRRNEELITGRLLSGILITGIFMTGICIAFLKLPLFRRALYSAEDIYFLTVFFVIIIFLGIFLSFSARTNRLNPLAGLGKNPMFVVIMTAASAVQFAMVEFGGNAIRCVPLAGMDVLRAVALALLVIPIDMMRKAILCRWDTARE